MKRLDDFKQIADEMLGDMTMNEETKQRIKQNLHTARKPVSTWFRSATAIAACVVLFISAVSVADLLPGRKETANEKLGQTTAVTYSATTAAPNYDSYVTSDGSNFVSEEITYALKALSEKETGIAEDTAFLLSTNDTSLTEAKVKQMVAISDGSEFDVTKSSDGEFTIRANERFAANSIVNIALTSNENQLLKTWVFQTESTLSVTSTLPSHQSAGTPINGGIEINFSRYIESLDGFFDIHPKTEGHFEYYGKTAVFVPETDLLSGTVYTVTVKEGIKAKTGEILEEKYSFSFKTPYGSNDSDTPFLRTGISESFIPGDPVVIELYANGDYMNKSADIVLYDLKTADAYRNAASYLASMTVPSLNTQGEVLYDTNGLVEYARFDCALQRTVNDPYGAAFLVFPESLPNGWYLAETKFEDGTVLHKLIQISPVSAYMMTPGNNAVVWVNSSATGEPISDISVSIDLGPSVFETKTDESGVALLEEIYTENTYALLNIGDTFCDMIELWDNRSGRTASSDRFLMTYTDREAYLPTDTVKLWGNVYDIRSKTKSFDLTVEIGNPKSPEAVYEIQTNKNGMFTVEIPLKNHQSGYVEYRIFEGDTQIYASMFQVIDYDKPIYTLKAESEKPYYRHMETPKATITASYFDGSPAQNLKISYYPVGTRIDQTTDTNGKTVFDLDIYQQRNTWHPQHMSEYFVTIGAEDVSVHAYANYIYFPTDYMLIIDELDNGNLMLSSNAIDYTKFDPNALDEDTLRGDISNVKGTVTAYRCTYEKEKIGEDYDFINKVKVPQYNYEYVETVVYETAFATEGGIYITPEFERENDPDIWYRYVILYTNPDGVECEASYSQSQYNPRIDTGIELSYGDYGTYDVGYNEEFTLPIVLSGSDGKQPQGASFLNVISTDSVLKYTVSEKNTYTDTFTKSYLPNVHLTGAYFDGKHIYGIDTVGIELVSDSLKLDVSVNVTNKNYKPGDTVNGTVSVKDPDGKPVAGVECVISVTDEAAFAILPQTYDADAALYRIRYYPRPVTYTSYHTHSFTSKAYAEGGGEGGSDSVRSEFVDNAAFINEVTDQNGTAAFTCKLPDNLTAWRLTAVAATDRQNVPMAGTATASVSTKLPYFINPVINDSFVIGDDVVLSLRASGSLAKGVSHYNVTVTRDGHNSKPIQDSATSHDSGFVYLNLGKLEEGTYTVQIEARNGNYKDAILEKFTVRPSAYEVKRSESIDLTKPLTLDAVRLPVTLICYDTELKAYYDTLLSLYAQNGERADQKLAHAKAADLLSELNPEQFSSVIDELDIQSYGGVRLVPYAEEDALLTAKTLIAAPEYIDKMYAVNYLNSVLCNKNASKDEVYAAYMGLAACKEPVLNEIRFILRADQTDDHALVYLYTALALLGDTETAHTWFAENSRSSLELSDAAAAEYGDYTLLALILGTEDSTKRLQTLCTYKTEIYLPVFEELYYVSRYHPAEDRNVKLTVKTDSDSETYCLGSGATVITLNNIENVTFAVSGGNASATALYTGTAKEFSDSTLKTATVTKTYETERFTSGDTIRVKLHIKLDGSETATPQSFILYDAIPSGMRFIKADYSYGSGWNLIAHENNQLTFGIAPGRYNRHLDEEKQNMTEFTITYYARCVLRGEFRSEPAILQSPIGIGTTLSEEKVVTIK